MAVKKEEKDMEAEELSHQAMGYDRTSAMFSPDGRLLQAEYAKKTVKIGTPAIGIACKDGAVIVVDKRVTEKLVVAQSVEKIFQVDHHIGAAASGIISDGRILIEKAQVIAQQHRVTFDEAIHLESLVKQICNIKQFYTQVGGARPFGVSLLFAGVNSKSNIYVTDPFGIFMEYKATAIGEGETEIKEILAKNYKETMTCEEGLKLAILALKTVVGKDFSIDRLDAARIDVSDKKFKKYSKQDMQKLVK